MDSSGEKRRAQVKAHITPSMRCQLELFRAAEGKVVSMSDYLFEVLDEHIAVKSIRISKQAIGGRAGNS